MIPEAMGLIKSLFIYMIVGCEELESALGLMHVGSSVLNGLYQKLETAESVVRQGVTAISDAYKEVQKQDALAKEFIPDAARVLRKYLGNRWSKNGWPETGFPNQSTATPRTFVERMLLCRGLQLFLKAHSEMENEKMEVTMARAKAVFEEMRNATKAVKRVEGAQAKKLELRDIAKEALRAGMQKLEIELGLVLTSSDPRWKEFGLEIPDAPSTPDAPKNVTVDRNIPGKYLLGCDPVAGVNIYRFFQLTMPGEEPVLVGKSYEPMLLINRPAPDAAVKYLISAKNLAGRESALSEPVEVKAAAA